MAITAAATFVGTNSWNADVYTTLSIASRLADAVAKRRIVYQLAFCFWRMNQHIDGLFGKFNAQLQKSSKSASTVAPGLVSQAAVETAIAEAIESVDRLHELLESIHTAATRNRLDDNPILAPGIIRLRRNDERIVELADWLRDMLNPAEFEAIFANAKAELDRGETVSVA